MGCSNSAEILNNWSSENVMAFSQSAIQVLPECNSTYVKICYCFFSWSHLLEKIYYNPILSLSSICTLRQNNWSKPWSESCGQENLCGSLVWDTDHLSQGCGTFHRLVHNLWKVTATNYTTPKQTDAYPKLHSILSQEKNI